MKRVTATREEFLVALGGRKPRRDGRTSAQGSHQTLGGWEPKTCYVCGKRVVARSGVFVRGLGSQPTSRHHTCQEG